MRDITTGDDNSLNSRLKAASFQCDKQTEKVNRSKVSEEATCDTDSQETILPNCDPVNETNTSQFHQTIRDCVANGSDKEQTSTQIECSETTQNGCKYESVLENTQVSDISVSLLRQESPQKPLPLEGILGKRCLNTETNSNCSDTSGINGKLLWL